jgi:tape measure domain-containing protein
VSSSERLDILITATGAQAAAREIESIGQSATRTTSLLSFMRAALVALASVEIVARFTQMADVFTTVQNRLILVTSSLKQANDVFNGLYQVAQLTRQPLEQTTDVFTRVARSAAGQALTFNELLDVTRGLNETLLLSGAAGTRAKQGLIELAEGLGLGVLQGRQLRSLIVDIPELANVIGKSVGVAGSQLFEFAQQNPGKLTPDLVIKSIINALPELDSQMNRSGLTFGQVFDRFGNALSTFLGQLNRATGAAGDLDKGLQFVATHLGQVTVGLAAFAGVVAFNFIVGQALALGAALAGIFGIVLRLLSVFGLLLVPFSLFRTIAIGIGAIVWAPLLAAFTTLGALVRALISPVQALTAAFGLLRLAVLTNPLFLTGAAVIGAGVAGFFLFRDQIDSVVNSLGGMRNIFNTLVNTAAAAAFTIVALWRQIPQAFADIGLQLGNSIVNGLKDGVNKIIDAYNNMRQRVYEILQQIKGGQSGESVNLSLPPNPIAPLDTTAPAIVNPFEGQAQQFLDAFRKAFEQLQATGTNPLSTGIDAAIAKARQLYAMVTGIGAGYGGTIGAGASGNDHPQGTGSIADLEEITKKAQSLIGAVSPIEKFDFALRELNKQLGDPALQHALEKEGFTAQDIVTATERNLAGIGNAVSDYIQKQVVLNRVLAAGKTSLEEYDRASLKLAIDFLDTQQDFSSGVTRTFLKMQQQTQDIASGIEKALTGAFNSANDAIVSFVTTGKVQIGDLFNSIESDLLKSALTGVEGNIGAALGFGKSSTGTVGGLANGFLGLFGLGDKSASTSQKNPSDLLSSFLNVPGLPGGAGMPVYVTNLGAGGLAAFGTGGSNPFDALKNFGNTDGGPTGASASTGIFSEIGSLLKSAGSGAEGALSGAGSWISSLFGYASGGSFEVGAGSSMGNISGIDNRLVAFRARDGERVTITQPGQVPGGIVQNFNISTPDANSFRRSQGQVATAAVIGASRMAQRNRGGQ